MNASRVAGTAFALVLLLGSMGSLAQDRSLSDSSNVPPPNDRFFVEDKGDIRVTSAVPSARETFRTFGFSLYGKNVQPVWIRIENRGDEILWFLPTGVDEEYYTPIETSYRRQNRIAFLDWNLNRDYYSRSMPMLIAPSQEQSGYVFTRVDQGTKSFNVDVFSNDSTHYRMSFFVPVPGLRLDHYRIRWQNLYAEDEIREIDLEGLVEYMEDFPCCVTDEDGRNQGDPLNLVLVHDVKDLYYAFMRAGWDETETIYSGSFWKTIGSALSGGEYRYSPVSALYVFGRPQDAALQKARTSVNERNHLRLWLTHLRLDGKPVWIGQISRDIGVRLTWKTITTHKIDPNVDDTRDYLLENLAYAESVSGFGFVGGVGAADYDNPRGNLTGDPYFTDGLRIVIFVSGEAVAIDELDYVDLGRNPAQKGSP